MFIPYSCSNVRGCAWLSFSSWEPLLFDLLFESPFLYDNSTTCSCGMITIPLTVFLSWPDPNYVNPQTRGPAIWILSPIFLSLATLCISARLYTRIFVRHWFGPDDALIIIAWVRLRRIWKLSVKFLTFGYQLSSLAVTVGVLVGNAKYDWNRHVYDMNLQYVTRKSWYFTKYSLVHDLGCSSALSFIYNADMCMKWTASLKTYYAVKLCWGIASSLVRLSILCLYYRLVSACHAPASFRYVLHVVTIFTTTLLLVYIFTGFIPCV